MSKRHYSTPSYSTRHPRAGQNPRRQQELEPPRRWSQQEPWRKGAQIAIVLMFVIYLVAISLLRS